MNINPSVSHSHACLCTARFIVNISHHHGNDRTLQTTYCYACFVVRRLVFFFFWASCSNHCLDGLHLGADVEQSFDCLIVQNRQPMLSMGRSIDWTLEDDMVDGLFFCTTLTGRRGGHTPLVQAGVEASDTSAEAVKPDPGSSWEGHSGRMGAGVRR